MKSLGLKYALTYHSVFYMWLFKHTPKEKLTCAKGKGWVANTTVILLLRFQGLSRSKTKLCDFGFQYQLFPISD